MNQFDYSAERKLAMPSTLQRFFFVLLKKWLHILQQVDSWIRTLVKTSALFLWTDTSDFFLIMSSFIATNSDFYEECFSVCRLSWSFGWVTLQVFFYPFFLYLNSKTNYFRIVDYNKSSSTLFLCNAPACQGNFFSSSCVSQKVTVFILDLR